MGRRQRRTRARLVAVLGAAAIVTGVVVPTAVSAQVAGFPDVPADSPHASAIADLRAREVVQGKTDGSFGPRDLLTRAQLASILARAEGLEPQAEGPFSDVSGPHAGAINALAERDIIRGKGDGTFDPQGTITRDQVASMIARYLDLGEVASGPFRDVPAANVHAGAINALAQIGVARGDERGDYQPRGQLRRDQAASFVSRGLAHADDGEPGEPGEPTPDCPAPPTGDLEVDHVVERSSVIAGCELELQLGVDVVDDLDRNGDTIRVVGSGFPGNGVATPGGVACEDAPDGCAGIYVSVCVLGDAHLDGPPSSGAAPSPCIGGVDMEGETGASKWISDAPPSYGVGLTDPFAPGGAFDVELSIAAFDDNVDCREADHGCAVVVRRDHVAPGDRSLDLYVPIEFGASSAVVGGDATWGVRQSFRNYITGPIAQGTITLYDGATQADGNGPFTLRDGVGTYDEASGELDVAYTGGVVFEGHDYGDGPLLLMDVSAVRIVIEDGEARLHADVESKSLESGETVAYPDVHLADLDLSEIPPVTEDGVTTWVDVPATLSEDGVPAFANFYAAGDDLDEVTFAVELAG